MWLVGSTDVTNFVSDIYNLLTGVTTAGKRGSGQTGNGASAGADAWEGVSDTDYIIRSPASDYDLIPRCPIRCWRGMPRFAHNGSNPNNDATYNFEKGMPTFIGTYNGVTSKVFFRCRVTTQNTSPGDLTGTVVTWEEYNSTVNNTTVATGTTSGWTGITGIKSLRDGISLQLTLQPTDTLTSTNPPYWMRGYSTSVTQGVDYIPELAAAIGTGVTVGFTSTDVNRFTLNTDYKLQAQFDVAPNTSQMSIVGSWGGAGTLVGIEWLEGGNPIGIGSTYWLINANLYGTYAQVRTSATTARYFGGLTPMIGFDITQRTMCTPCLPYPNGIATNIPSENASSYSSAGGVLFSIPSPSGSLYINYWISIKPTKIVIFTISDPASSGVSQCQTVQRCIPVNENVPWRRWITSYIWAYIGTYPYQIAAAQYSSQYLSIAPYWGLPSKCTATQLIWGTMNTANSGIYPEKITISGAPVGIFIQQRDSYSEQWNLFPIMAFTFFGYQPSTDTYVGTESGAIIGQFQDIYALPTNYGWNNLDELINGTDRYLLMNFGTDQAYHFASKIAIKEN